MLKKILKYLIQEETLIPVLMLTALLTAFSPFVYELTVTSRSLPESRYPLFETDFPPDLRVYLSRMRQGVEGKWLVSEKYTAEIHRPSVLHVSYLLMGKLAGGIGLQPPEAFQVWRLIASLFMMAGGYFFLLQVFSQKWQRIAAFLLYVFVGNLPLPVKTGMPFLGFQFSSFLGWYTFFDPTKRLFFLPHYNLAAGFFALSLAFLWRGVQKQKRNQFVLAGIFGFLAGIILPTNLMVSFLTAGLFFLSVLLGLTGKLPSKNLWLRIKVLVVWSWPFWLFLGLGFFLIFYSFTYFPWKIHGQADVDKRFMGFDHWGTIFGLGTTGLLGLAGTIWVLWRRKAAGFLSALWLLVMTLLIAFFRLFPVSNPYRPLQIELHLPLAITSLCLIESVAGFFRQKRRLVLAVLLALLILPSLIVWPVDLKAQRMFVNDKVSAGYPLIPTIPFVVYPVKDVMAAVFWLRDRTDHDRVVLAAETLGSMIPGYAGNTVVLGHGNQTVDYRGKVDQMIRFYRGLMSPEEASEFLSRNRVSYVFWGPEEQAIAGGRDFFKEYFQSEVVFQNDQAAIYQVR